MRRCCPADCAIKSDWETELQEEKVFGFKYISWYFKINDCSNDEIIYISNKKSKSGFI
jgi:hypothetical protein